MEIKAGILEKIETLVKIRFFRITYGKNLQIRGRVNWGWRVNLTLGDNVIINSGMKNNPNPIGNEMVTSFTTVYDGKIIIGDNVGLSNCCIYSRNEVIIQDYAMIGGGTIIFDTDFHPLDKDYRLNNIEEKVISKPVIIKKNAFIGARCIIMKGVIIGENCVIGAGSVVTKSVPDNEVWAGNPAKYVRNISNRR